MGDVGDRKIKQELHAMSAYKLTAGHLKNLTCPV